MVVGIDLELCVIENMDTTRFYEGHPISSDNDLIKQNLFLYDLFQ